MKTPVVSVRPVLAVLLIAAGAAAPARLGAEPPPLPIEASLETRDTDIFAGVYPSPDGRWIAFDTSDAREALSFDYDMQGFSFDGYPFWASLSLYRTQIVSRETGQATVLASPRGTSWSGSWSPDGRHYAFYSNRSGRTTVWVWDANDGSTRQVSEIGARMFRSTERPLWTPDGRRIIFKAVPEGMTLMDLHRLNPKYVAKERAGRKLTAEELNRPKVTVYRTYDPAGAKPGEEAGNWFIDYRFMADLVSVDVQTGAVLRLESRRSLLRHALSADGKWVATVVAGGPVPNTQKWWVTLAVQPAAGGEGRILADQVVMPDPIGLSWSPDGSRIAYVALESDMATDKATYRCYVVEVGTGKKTLISSAIPGTPRLDRNPPLWSPDGRSVWLIDSAMAGNIRSTSKHGRLWSLAADGSGGFSIDAFGSHAVQDIVQEPEADRYWSPDGGRKLVVGTRNDATKREAYFLVDTGTRQAELLAEYDAYLHRNPKGSPGDREHFSFLKEDAANPVDLHTFNIRTREARKLTHLSPAFAQAPLGGSRLIDYLSAEGEPLRGALLLPAGYQPGRRYPLVVWMYAGSYGSDKVNAFAFGYDGMFNFQVLASRGYAVLFPDIPRMGVSPMQDVARAVLPAVNRVIELGVADPERLAVMGQSHGGYNTMGLITQTNRFKAAVATSSGAAELFEGFARFNGASDSFGYFETGQGGMRGTPWELPLRYIENSPFFFLDRVTTPLLIQRGTEDGISTGNGLIYQGLKRLGKKAVFLEYENEGHVLQIPADIVDFWRRQLAFLAEHLDLALDANGKIIFAGDRAKPRAAPLP